MALPAVLELYAPITKREKDPTSGHLYVYGKLTGTDLDHDQQRMSGDWLKTAVPDWFLRAGNIREGHDHRRAVGKAVELEEKPDGWYIGAKIVDREAVEKVEEGVLNGFSIGVRGHRLDYSKADAPGGTVVAGRICESSLVDSPCLPTATLTEHWRLPLAKSDGSGELHAVEEPSLIRSTSPTYGLPPELFESLADPVKQALADLAASGAHVAAEAVKADTPDEPTPLVVNVTVQQHAAPPAAGPDAHPPISSKADLRKAVKAADTDPQRAALRKHITARAEALGLEAMVPEHWNDGEPPADTAPEAVSTAVPAETAQKAEAVLRDVRALVPDLAKADAPGIALDGADDAGASTPDIDGATAAIAAIAALIVSEAQSLALGNFNELLDIRLLMEAAAALKYFVCREQAEDPDGGTGGDMTLAEDATLLKAKNPNLAPPFKKKTPGPADGDEPGDGTETPDPAAPDGGKTPKAKKPKNAAKADHGEHGLTKAEAAELVKAAVAEALAQGDGPAETTPAPAPDTVTKAQLADLVKTAVAEARAADEERIKALTVDVAKASAFEAVKDLPQPGGPVLTRTAAQQGAATKSDAELLREQAAALMAKADQFPANRDLAEGYRDRARALLAKAAA